MSCFPRAECLEAETPDEKEPHHLTDTMRQTGDGYSDRNKCLSRPKMYRTCRSPLGSECFPVAPWQLCAAVQTDPGSCGWRAQRWIDFILLPLPPDLWRAWETWGSLFWMITPPHRFVTMLGKLQCRQLNSSLNKSGPTELSYSFFLMKSVLQWMHGS